MPQNDPPVAASELLGRVAGIGRANRSFVPSRRVSLLQSALAKMLCHSDRIRVLACSFMRAATGRSDARRSFPALPVSHSSIPYF